VEFEVSDRGSIAAGIGERFEFGILLRKAREIRSKTKSTLMFKYRSPETIEPPVRGGKRDNGQEGQVNKNVN
jgi:hypothetical protein